MSCLGLFFIRHFIEFALTIFVEIEYSYSNAPVKSISPLGEKLTDAIRSSKQWQWERAVGQNEVTGCITALAPKDRNIDISLNMLVGFEMGNKLIEELRLIPM